jgi:hypothetical protein
MSIEEVGPAAAAAAAAGAQVVVVRTLFGSRVLVPRDRDPFSAGPPPPSPARAVDYDGFCI